MKQIAFVILSFLIVIPLSNSEVNGIEDEIILQLYDYPIIISEQGTNHTLNKELVYSIPTKYFEYIDRIEFVNDYLGCEIIDAYGQKRCLRGWSWVHWDENHKCYNGKIILSENSLRLLMHESGHIYELCKLKRNITTEEFANNFK